MFRKWQTLRKRSKGFTLIELMIVVAIIAILAAIAIPQYKKFQLKSKTAEAKVNLGAIKTCEEAFYGEHDTYLTAATLSPGHTLGTNAHMKMAWTDKTAADDAATTEDDPTVTSFAEMGFQPAGEVYYDYAVTTGDSITVGSRTYVQDCTICAQSDLDADGTAAVYVLGLDGDQDGTGPIRSSCAGTPTPTRHDEIEGPSGDDF